jgi:hypothetical protein
VSRAAFAVTALALTILFGAGSDAFAHRLDEYLQATLVAIEPEGIRLQINLTPGVAVAGKVLAIIDSNHDGVVSTNEGAAYCERLARDLSVKLDGSVVKLKLSAFNVPAPEELRSGSGIIQVEFAVAAGFPAPGRHRFSVLDSHLPEASVYLFNAGLPSSAAVKIIRQTRNENQSFGEIEFSVEGAAGPTRNAPVGFWVAVAGIAGIGCLVWLLRKG